MQTWLKAITTLHFFRLSSSPHLLAAAAVLLFSGCVAATQGTAAKAVARPAVSGIAPAMPLSAGLDLKPGLSALYITNFFERHLDRLPSGEALYKKGFSGKPIPSLNHRFGVGNVFDSGESQGVAMELKGYIQFQQTGTYGFQALSNDGIRVLVGDRTIIDDPDVHSDRLSPVGTLAVDQPGWYDITVRYFQRKGTATLVLKWMPPSAAGFTPVPPDVLAHRGTVPQARP